jgi:hypothetical protein
MLKKIVVGVTLLLTFFLALMASFIFEERYRSVIRFLYETLSEGKISFLMPAKFMHFASFEFMVSFALFVSFWVFLLIKKISKQRIIQLGLGIVLFIISTIIISYFDSIGKLVQCTACNDGTRKLHIDDIRYDLIFMISLFMAIVPVLVSEGRLYFNKK